MGQVFYPKKKEEKKSLPKKSLLQRTFTPMSDAPSRIASKVAEPMMQYGERDDGLLNKASLYGGAFLQSFGDVVSSQTSPGAMALGASRLLPVPIKAIVNKLPASWFANAGNKVFEKEVKKAFKNHGSNGSLFRALYKDR